MPSFRQAKHQAAFVIKQHLAIGKSKHQTKTSDKIYSVGTARNYEQALTKLTHWLRENKRGDLQHLTVEISRQYLEIRAQEVGQKTLDQERQAIQMCIGQKITVIKSELQSIQKSRAYTQDQIDLIAKSQTAKYQLATQIAHAAGLRAHELLAIRKPKDQPKSSHRKWTKARFNGREGEIYTVIGKGGLIREVLIPTALAKQLETRRLQLPTTTYDRKIKYQQYYDIGGGKKWTDSFSTASKRLFNWSHGAHGLRHTYAQERLEELQQKGTTYKEVLGIISQELGHFRPDITEVYLR